MATLKGKVAIVTGSSRGIGRAVVSHEWWKSTGHHHPA